MSNRSEFEKILSPYAQRYNVSTKKLLKNVMNINIIKIINLISFDFCQPFIHCDENKKNTQKFSLVYVERYEINIKFCSMSIW